MSTKAEIVLNVSFDETQTTLDALADSIEEILNAHGDGMYYVGVKIASELDEQD